MNELYGLNSLDSFWCPIEPISEEVWREAISIAAKILPSQLGILTNGDINEIEKNALNESLFGENRYQLSPLKSAYYVIARPLFPSWVRPLIRKFYRPSEDVRSILNWPTEERYAQFQFALISRALSAMGRNTMDIVGFWPHRKRFSFVLTHDVEGRSGLEFVRQVMNLEEKYGFRSSFNFVPEGYEMDHSLLEEMRTRGFEVGVHGLKHDGRLFSTRRLFGKRAKWINHYLAEWGAVGFRSPLTHRNPEWMQDLDIKYDLSFFDTDPYETMPGGTMSLWPFFIGRFVELPYTLMQDHRYLEVMEQRTPELWLEKVDFIESYHGMVLINSHPDYLLKPGGMEIYEGFLNAMSQRAGCWHALPRDVADWWRQRTSGSPDKFALSGKSIWTVEGQVGKIQIHIG